MRTRVFVGRVGAALGAAAGVLALAAAGAQAAPVSENLRFTASDGVTLQTTITGEGPIQARPTIVEFSPYGRNSQTFTPGPDYNQLLVQIRGTGDSDGRFDALGPRTQQDVAEVLDWACHQPWTNGELGLNGFSASAITIYNSLHLQLPCVKAAVLKSGTHELYRDLLYPGGINNIIPGTGVLGLIGAPALAQGLDRLGRAPLSSVDIIAGLTNAGLSDLAHPTLDTWWRERGMRGDVNHLPILMIDGFFDVESRGAFQAYQALRGDGAHLMVIGAHDGAPAGTDGGTGEAAAWFDHYVRGVANGVQAHPKVQLWLADGDREDDLAGDYVRYDGSDWPIPGTRWAPLALDATRSHSAHSLNDGTLTLGGPGRAGTPSYPSLPSFPLATDPPNTAILGGFGVNALATALPLATDMTLAEPLGVSFTTAPLQQDVLTAGPMDLDLRLSSTAPETGIWPSSPTCGRTARRTRWPAGACSAPSPASTTPSRCTTPSAATSSSPTGSTTARRPPGCCRPGRTTSSCGRSATASAPGTGCACTSSGPPRRRCPPCPRSTRCAWGGPAARD
jgi:predicted acyl esterase